MISRDKIPQLLRDYLSRNNLTHAQAAERFDVSRQAITAWLNGRLPKFNNYEKILRELELWDEEE